MSRHVLNALHRFRPAATSESGDTLPLSERASWFVQRIIRNWAFLGVISLVTAWVWFIADPIWRHPVTDQWNLAASYLAIFVEGVTAMALINQTKRDAVVIREIRALAQTIEQRERRILEGVEQLESSEPSEEGE